MQQKLDRCYQLANTSVNLQSLPFCFLTEKHLLPKTSGVYFVIDETGKVYYIGKAVNFRRRWASHHRLNELQRLGKQFKIAYLTIAEQKSLLQIERTMITEFSPLLNGVKNKERIVKDIQFWTFEGTYATVKEACTLLDCTEGYVRRMLIVKRLDGIKIGCEWLIPVVNGKLEVKEKS